MPMPGAPPMPPGVKPLNPPGAATLMNPPMAGQDAKGDVMAGLGLWFLGRAVGMFTTPQGMSEKGQALAEAVAKLGRKFKAPDKDLGQAELKFMASQYGGPQQGAGPQGQPGPQGPPQSPPPSPMASLAGAGVPAAAEGGA